MSVTGHTRRLTIHSTPLAIQRWHLLNVVRALREDDDPEKFSMSAFGRCGTPACALGHYAVRTDLQDLFALVNGRWEYDPTRDELIYRDTGRFTNFDTRLLQHFGISGREADELFEGNGCDHAKTPLQAAAYIEAFVARKWSQWSTP